MQSSRLIVKKWNIREVRNHRNSNSTELAAECIENAQAEHINKNSSVSFRCFWTGKRHHLKIFGSRINLFLAMKN